MIGSTSTSRARHADGGPSPCPAPPRLLPCRVELGVVPAELGRQPRTARARLLRYRDRVLMGKKVVFLCGNFRASVPEASVRRQLDTGHFLR